MTKKKYKCSACNKTVRFQNVKTIVNSDGSIICVDCYKKLLKKAMEVKP